jgi:hypothetical protein
MCSLLGAVFAAVAPPCACFSLHRLICKQHPSTTNQHPPSGLPFPPRFPQGYGTLLMLEAERIARTEHRSSKLAVISGVGTRHYYRRLGCAPACCRLPAAACLHCCWLLTRRQGSREQRPCSADGGALPGAARDLLALLCLWFLHMSSCVVMCLPSYPHIPNLSLTFHHCTPPPTPRPGMSWRGLTWSRH